MRKCNEVKIVKQIWVEIEDNFGKSMDELSRFASIALGEDDVDTYEGRYMIHMIEEDGCIDNRYFFHTKEKRAVQYEKLKNVLITK